MSIRETTTASKYSRRKLLKFSLLLSLSPGAVGAAGRSATSSVSGDSDMPSCSNILVAYFTRSGNTRVIAEQLHRDLNADIFEIQSEQPYPQDYEENVEQARKERDSGYEPPLKALVSALEAYDTLFLGFPIWGGTTPPVIKSFLSVHDLSGKTVIPFITHGKYGPGDSLSVLRERVGNARLVDGLYQECDQERDTMELVDRWLDGLSIADKNCGHR